MPTGIRRRAALAVVAVLAGALALAPALPQAAIAAGGEELMVSLDGSTFTAGNDLPIFTSMGRVVPGDRATESVWVRNDAATAGMLRVDMLDASTDDPELADGFTLDVQAPGLPRSAVTVGDAVGNGPCTVVGDGLVLQPGQVVRLDLTAEVSSALAGQAGSLGTVSFRLRGVLTEAAAASPLEAGAACQVALPDFGDLSGTGSSSPVLLVVIGIVAVVGGAFIALVAHRRRRRRDESAEAANE